MLADLRRFPCVYATSSHRTCVAARIAETAEHLAIYAHSQEMGLSFKEAYDESALYKIRYTLKETLSWERFFAAVAEAFSTGALDVKPMKATSALSTHQKRVLATDKSAGDTWEDVTQLHVICHTETAGSITFVVSRIQEDTQAFILRSLLSTHETFVYSKAHHQQLVRLKKDEKAARKEMETLERETLSLKESVNRDKRLESLGASRKADLQLKYDSLRADDTSDNSCTDVVAAQGVAERHLQSFSQLNPLGNRPCAKYDNTLLRLIKSRWLTAEACDADAPYNRVIPPFTQLEFDMEAQLTANRRGSIWQCMDRIDEWDYNVFDVQKMLSADADPSQTEEPACGVLFLTMYSLLFKYGLMQKFSMDEQTVLNWLSAVEAGYHHNPYHNFTHAADVVHIIHFLLSKGKLRDLCHLTDEEVFSALFAAAIHDFAHPGINNNFLIKTGSYLAELYNDRSVLENMHVSSAFELMRNPAFNILESFSEDQRREIRETVVEMVLATDMSLHGQYLARLKARLKENATFTNREDKQLALALALKMADISNCGRPLDLYLQWSARISDEFYCQGDRERHLGMACSPFMDRLNPDVAKGQIAFINYIIIPFFEQMSELLPTVRFTVHHAENNKTYWAVSSNHDP